MINSLHIEGYRCFEQFDMVGLGRINLLVGTNNSGKTSVLEALYLLASMGDPASLCRLLFSRGERTSSSPLSLDAHQRNQQQLELDVSHLFTGHDASPFSKITLSARNQSIERSLSLAVLELSPKEQAEQFGPDIEPVLPSRLVLTFHGQPKPRKTLLSLSRSGGINPDSFEMTIRNRPRSGNEEPPLFITTESLTGDDLVSMWNRVALTPAENLVVKALQFLDPSIEAIAPQVSSQQPYYPGQSRGGFIVRCKGSESPIPIGSMGDGMWRMLAIAIALTQCRGGILLVDEIDTGLHYSVMAQMWRLIFNTAKELDVQVFATTHSYDCVYSLAQICPTDSANPVTVHRIEADKKNSIPYDEEEITVAAAREIEVR